MDEDSSLRASTGSRLSSCADYRGTWTCPRILSSRPDRIAQTKNEIGAARLNIACVSSSANLYFEDAAKREKEFLTRGVSSISHRLWDAPYVRVFGGKAQDDKSPAPDDATKARVASGLRELGKYSGPKNVTVIIESHDHFTSSATLKDVLNAADSDHVACSGMHITPSPPRMKSRSPR